MYFNTYILGGVIYDTGDKFDTGDNFDTGDIYENGVF
jgi:hypothetical protein